MAKRVTKISSSIEERLSENNKRITKISLLTEEKYTLNNKRITDIKLMVEYVMVPVTFGPMMQSC
jgi:hypothetical protein